MHAPLRALVRPSAPNLQPHDAVEETTRARSEGRKGRRNGRRA
eukprot:COSAG04_NODE_26633_length_292_cov_1.243523_2_plen_42_part_01